MMKIALFGTGLMGAPMAERLKAAGHEVMVFNRTREKVLPLAEKGIHLARDPAEAVAFADWIVLMLADFPAISQTLLTGDHDFSSKNIIQMGTIASTESRQLQQTFEASGAVYLECPVLGSRNEARNGTLILMAGGAKEQFEKAEGLLKIFGPEPKYIGPVGSAATLKLSLNQLIASLAVCFSFSLGLVERSRIDVDLFMSILKKSALFAPMFEKKLPNMRDRRYDDPNFPARHLLKDVKLVIGESGDKGLPPAHLDAVRNILEEVMKKGIGDGDYSCLYEVVNPRSRDTS